MFIQRIERVQTSLSGEPKIPHGVQNEELVQTDFITRGPISNWTLELSFYARS